MSSLKCLRLTAFAQARQDHLYNDFQSDFTLQNIQPGARVQRLLTYAVGRLRRKLYVIPFLNPSCGSVAATANPRQSLLSTAPNTCSIHRFTQFQCYLGSQNVFVQPRVWKFWITFKDHGCSKTQLLEGPSIRSWANERSNHILDELDQRYQFISIRLCDPHWIRKPDRGRLWRCNTLNQRRFHYLLYYDFYVCVLYANTLCTYVVHT
jgi:hypothetical protein